MRYLQHARHRWAREFSTKDLRKNSAANDRNYMHMHIVQPPRPPGTPPFSTPPCRVRGRTRHQLNVELQYQEDKRIVKIDKVINKQVRPRKSK